MNKTTGRKEEPDGSDTIYNNGERSSYPLMDQDIHQHLHLNHTGQHIPSTHRQMKYHRSKMNRLQQTCLQNCNTPGRVQPPLHSKMSLNLHLRMLWHHHQNTQTNYRKQGEQEVDRNLRKRWRNTHLHICPIQVGVPFASKQKASKMPTNNNNQSNQSYRLTLHTSRHLQMSKALQHLQQLMYNHN